MEQGSLDHRYFCDLRSAMITLKNRTHSRLKVLLSNHDPDHKVQNLPRNDHVSLNNDTDNQLQSLPDHYASSLGKT